MKPGYENCTNPSMVFVTPLRIGIKNLWKFSLQLVFLKARLIFRCSLFRWIPCILMLLSMSMTSCWLNDTTINEVKNHLQNSFNIKDLVLLKYFLDIEVAHSKEGFVISQRKYTLDILEDCGMTACKPSNFPMEKNLKLRKDDDSEEVNATHYRRLVGRLLYLTVTRPGITFAVNQLSQFLCNPWKTHLDKLHRVLRYLKATPGQGFFLLSFGSLHLITYCDASWLSCRTTRRSCTWYFISLGGSPVSWRTKKQTVVSRSSAEAKYKSMASTVCEVLWLRWLLQDLDADQNGPTRLMCDNETARHIAANPIYHERTKDVEMNCYFVHERIHSGEVKTVAIKTNSQTAYIFTKALGHKSSSFSAASWVFMTYTIQFEREYWDWK